MGNRFRTIGSSVFVAFVFALALLLGSAQLAAAGRLNRPASALSQRPDRGGRNDSFKQLTMIILAFDNPQASPGNLTPLYGDTVSRLVAASTEGRDQAIVVLADLDQVGDTHILLIVDGTVSEIDGLPTADGLLDSELTEYDLGDGPTIGYFLRWARDTYPAERSSMLFYGHGAPLIPETATTQQFAGLSSESSGDSVNGPIPLPSWVTALPSWVTALPSWVTANPDLTDVNPLSLLSVYDLGVALAIATDDGADPIDVVDLVHCFSLTIEQAYEIAPYSEAITGSANYAYYDVNMPAAAVRALGQEHKPDKMARKLIEAYDDVLPANGYPRIMTALESDRLEDVKEAWDDTAAALLNGLSTNPVGTRAQLLAAYAASAKYDTTQCQAEWALDSPDALSDVYDFASALRSQFGNNTAIGKAARTAAQRIDRAVIKTLVRNGQPYFVDVEDAPFWTFDGVGIGIYTDFVGQPADGGATLLSWQYAFYNGTVSTFNPQPYRFLQSAGGPTWGDLFGAFWGETPIEVELCLRTFPQPIEPGEVSADAWVTPQPGSVVVGEPLQPALTLTTAGELRNIQVSFEVVQNGMIVYSNTVGTGYLITGTHTVAAATTWTPGAEGDYTLRATVDSHDVVDEQNEEDNVLLLNDSVLPAPDQTGSVVPLLVPALIGLIAPRAHKRNLLF